MNIHTLKVTAILSVFLFLCMPTMAQQRGKDESLRKVLDKMFAHIDKNKVPTGLLRDYAEEYEDLDIFTGIVPLTEHNAADYVRFGYLLSTIKSADLILSLIHI